MLGIVAVGVGVAFAAPLSAAVPGDLDGDVSDAGGRVTTNLGGTYDWPYAVAIQPDGKTVVAGVSNAEGTHDFAVARYNPDPSLDPNFGQGGTVTTDFGDSWDWAYAVDLQPDGKIVVGGVSDRSGSRDFAVARYINDGTLDLDFGDRGLATVGLRPLSAEMIHALVVESDGGILAGGVTFEDQFTIKPNADFLLTRLRPDGRVDPTFGLGGLTSTDLNAGSYDEAYAMVRQPDGHIVLGGYTFANGTGGGGGDKAVPYGSDDLALARYRPDGMADDTFGDRGRMVVDVGTLDEEIHGLALTPAGRIIAVGHVNGEQSGDMMVGRFHTDGTVDTAFGDEGFTITTPFGSRSERLNAVALQPDGKIVAAGQIAQGPTGDFAVARYTPEGTLDASFGSDGIRAVDFGGREDRIRAVALQRDGKIVGVGMSETDFGLIRLYG